MEIKSSSALFKWPKKRLRRGQPLSYAEYFLFILSFNFAPYLCCMLKLHYVSFMLQGASTLVSFLYIWVSNYALAYSLVSCHEVSLLFLFVVIIIVAYFFNSVFHCSSHPFWLFVFLIVTYLLTPYFFVLHFRFWFVLIVVIYL
jgi:hypothetical protein